MTTPEIIQQLVKRFEEHKETYRSGKYNETQLRREFLDPFFEALGWDVFNKQGYAEMYKDVVHEDSLEIEGENKAPDYAFRIGGQRKFFLEAKKPAVKIETDIHPAFQLRRYAWSAKLPLSILSDFEELAIYDCRAKPDKKDKASVGRVRLYSYKDYVEKWDEISSIFSREAVLRGSFDAFAEGTKLKKGTAEVDDAFLEEIERWRDLLATNIAIKNESLSVRELNYAVQMTIDRIVFLRICEDRGVERDEQLKEIGAGAGVYEALCQLFKRADARYNSGLFHFSEEKDASSPTDSLTLTIQIDDKPLKDIIKNLYYPESPYVFREIPADILGQVYERFLGKVIRLTAGHRAKVEEKPEVRKAGGVYYTPTYIVEYIVENTVGKLLEGKTPKEAEKIRVLDPACGSGTFPLGAYQYLIDWHLKWYMDNDPEKWATGKKPVIFQTKDGYRLTTSKKKDILLNNIYGVDIDPQAVEVTKLSLLLKVLEGESHETIGSQLALFQERVLPDLGKNIKCGNSLIGNDYYEGRQLTMLVDEEERYRVNAFDWKAEFSQVFIQGGFDAVIGNPPYIRIQTIQEWTPESAEHFKNTYKSAQSGNYDIYVVFIERGLMLLNKSGQLGFIMPAKFWQVQYGESLRQLLSTDKNVSKIVSFTNNQVFNTAFVNTCILVLSKASLDRFDYVEIPKIEKGHSLAHALNTAEESSLPSSVLSNAPWVLKSAKVIKLLEKLTKQGVALENCTSRIFQGLKTSADKIYVLDLIKQTETSWIGYSPHLDREVEVESGLFHLLIKGTEMRPYTPLPAKRVVLFPYTNNGDSMSLIGEDQLQAEYPKTYAYLKENEKYLRGRENGKMNHSRWYGYVYPKALDVISLPKLITPDLAPRSSFLLDSKGEYFLLGGAAGGYGIIPNHDISSYYLLGLLNSRLLNFFITSSGQQIESGYYSFEARFIRATPIRPINFDDPADKARHDKLVSLVERMLALHKQSPRTPQEQEMVKREIESTDRGIDGLVYELYGLSEEEIRIVEGQ